MNEGDDEQAREARDGNEEARCPCCKGKIEYSPDQDGSCDYACTRCRWNQHVPGDGDLAEFKGDTPSEVPTRQARTGLRVDLGLLEKQAATLGKVTDGSPLTDDERSCLEGLWEFAHTILDGAEADGQGQNRPTVVVFVEGGVVQGVEGNAPVRVILCDFDVTDGAREVAGRPCHIGVWDAPETPSKEFEEVLRLAGSDLEHTSREGE